MPLVYGRAYKQEIRGVLGGAPLVKPTGEVAPKFSFQVNQPYADRSGDSTESLDATEVPPTLPPRNYRTGRIVTKSPPPEPPDWGATTSPKSTDWDLDTAKVAPSDGEWGAGYDGTLDDSYARQLRHQAAKRLSNLSGHPSGRPNSGGGGGGSGQQAIYRSTQVARDLNYVGLEGDSVANGAHPTVGVCNAGEVPTEPEKHASSDGHCSPNHTNTNVYDPHKVFIRPAVPSKYHHHHSTNEVTGARHSPEAVCSQPGPVLSEEEERCNSPAFRAILTNFERSNWSSLEDDSDTALRDNTNTASPPMTRSKVTMMRETLLRRSNENLLSAIADDTPPNSDCLAQFAARRRSPIYDNREPSRIVWTDAAKRNVADVSAFSRTPLVSPAQLGINEGPPEENGTEEFVVPVQPLSCERRRSHDQTCKTVTQHVTQPSNTSTHATAEVDVSTTEHATACEPHTAMVACDATRPSGEHESRESNHDLSTDDVQPQPVLEPVAHPRETTNHEVPQQQSSCEPPSEPQPERHKAESIDHSLQPTINEPVPCVVQQPTATTDDPPTVVQHQRHKSQEEMEYEQQAVIVASQLPDHDRHLSDVIVPSPEMTSTIDYMRGIFDTAVNATAMMTRKTSIGGAQTDRANRSISPTPQHESEVVTSPLPATSAYWSPPSLARLQSEMRQQPPSCSLDEHALSHNTASIQAQKVELVGRIEKKLEILVKEKESLNSEFEENAVLGEQVTQAVQSVTTDAEFKKFKLYVIELEKVLKLLLQLSGRLARANNALAGLSHGAADDERVALTQKRDELHEKHEDARSLKDGIDRRRHQVDACLGRCLSSELFTDYEYYVRMTAKLTLERHEVSDRILLGRQQLAALHSSMSVDT